MSYCEEDVVTVPWVGQSCYKNSLTVVVLSPNTNIVENISEALIDVHNRSSNRWKLAVLRCTSLDNIIRQTDLTGKIGLDFIIVALDISKVFSMKWVKSLVEQVHPDLRMRRVVLVNTSGPSIAVLYSEVLTFCAENKLDLLNANTTKKNEAEFLAQRLIKYIEVSVGHRTGIPNLNI